MTKFLAGYSGSRVLVLGGAGFLGSHIVRRVAAAGARLTIVDAMLDYSGSNRFNLRDLPPQAELVESDVRFLGDLDRRLEASDLVIDAMGTAGHHWAYEHPQLDLACNVGSHLAVLEAFRTAKHKPRLIVLGTRAVYGRAQRQTVDESHPTHPIDIQGIHKVAAERHLVLLGDQMGLTSIVMRLGNCYGPGMRLSGNDVGLVGGFLRDIMAGMPATVFGGVDRERDFLFVDDLADAVLAAGVLIKEGRYVLNIGGKNVRLVHLVQEITASVGRGEVEIAHFPEDIQKIDPGQFVLDCSLAKNLVGWEPKTPLAVGIKETVKYYAAYGKYYGIEG